MTIGEEDLRKEVTLSASLNSDAKTSWLTSETTDGDQPFKIAKERNSIILKN